MEGGTPAPETKTCSKSTRKRNVRLRRRNASRNGGEPLLKRRCGESNKQSFLLNTALVLAITNRAENLCYQFRHG